MPSTLEPLSGMLGPLLGRLQVGVTDMTVLSMRINRLLVGGTMGSSNEQRKIA